MKKFNDPVEKAAGWLGGAEEGEKRWWLLAKLVAGVLGLLVIVYLQLPPHLKQ